MHHDLIFRKTGAWRPGARPLALNRPGGQLHRAAFTKFRNGFPLWRAEVNDRHHPWHNTKITGKVLAVPACIGSIHTGLVLLDLVRKKAGPAAMIVDEIDTLMVSEILLSEVWYERSVPIVEYPTAEIRAKLTDGQIAEVDGDSSTITQVEDR